MTVNGRTMLIPRGQEVNIPWRYYEALKNAEMTEYEHVVDKDNPTKVEEVVTSSKSYPFHTIEMPSKKAVAEWLAKKADEQVSAVKAEKQRRREAVAEAIGATAA